MVSRGSHSRTPLTSKQSFWLAQGPAERYHFPAPGVVNSAEQPWSILAFKVNSSPPAIPPGGCTTIAWHTASPSGYNGFCTTNGPSECFSVKTLLWFLHEKPSERSAFQGARTGSATRIRKSYRQEALHAVAFHVGAAPARDDFASLHHQVLVMERGEIVARGRGADMERDGVKRLLAV